MFPRKSAIEVQFVVFTYKTRIRGAPFHRQPSINWIFTQTKLSSTYTDESSYTYDEASGVACNAGET